MNAGRQIPIAAAMLLPSLLVRAGSLAGMSAGLQAEDLYGYLSGAGVALLLAWAAFLPREGLVQPLATFLATLYVVFLYANHEHILVHGASIDAYYAYNVADPTFVQGSGLQVRYPELLGAMILPSLLLIWGDRLTAFMRDGPVVSPRDPRARSAGRTGASTARPAANGASTGERVRLPWLAAGLGMLASAQLGYAEPGVASWRQLDVIHQNLLQLPGLLEESLGDFDRHGRQKEALGRRLPPELKSRVDALTRADLSGEPRLELGHQGRNVLLIILESASGAHFRRLSSRHGYLNRSGFFRTEARMGQALFYRNFVDQQRRTDRGEYSILCGEHPNLGLRTSKMHAVAVGGRPRPQCLASVLGRAGYQAVYLQAAPLDYMGKVDFMKNVGFDRFLGKSWFSRAYHWNTWGPDDRAFFEQALDMVRELRGAGKPWFLVLLNVGTHHPYPAPPGFGSRFRFGSAERAFDYLDAALADHLKQLRLMGVLEDTLVIITSDESWGYQGGEELQRMYSQNWGALVALTPDRDDGVVDEAFQQSDLALGILDYLGLAEEAASFGGRSIFRRYGNPRPIIFGNIYRREIHAIWDEKRVTSCSIELDRCAFLERGDASLVSDLYTRRKPSAVEVEALRYFMAGNDFGVRARR
jgi:hypothetical protein